MSTHVICPECGARNAQGAPWCGQCYRPLAEPQEEPAPVTPVGDTVMDDPQMQLELALPDTPRSGREIWTCVVCENVNPLTESLCPVCGASIFDAFREPPPEPRDPQRALLRGLLAPGLGHLYARQAILGASVAALVVVGLALGVVLMVNGVKLAGLGLVLIGVGVWVVGAMDAYRWARRELDEVLLRPRVLTVIMGVILILLVAAAISARGAG